MNPYSRSGTMRYLWPWVLVLACLSGSCAGVFEDIHPVRNLEVRRAPDGGRIAVQRIAILPFVSPRFQAEAETGDLVCSFCGHPLREHKDFSRAGERLAEYLYAELRDRGSYEILPLEESFSRLRLEEASRDPFADVGFLMAFGKKLGVDAMVVGEILRVREREGGEYSVVAPASVAFQVKMVRVADGRELLQVSFDETQRPWSEEPGRLLHWSRLRFRWQTADRLAREGMRDVATAFPGAAQAGGAGAGRP